MTLCQPWGQTVLVSGFLNDAMTIRELLSFTKKEPISEFRIQQGLKILVGAIQLISEDMADPPLIVSYLSKNMDYYTEVLRNLTSNNTRVSTEMSFGPVTLFGFARYQIIEMYSALICTGFPIVVSMMASSGAFSVLVDIFFSYKWNNLIHNQVTHIFSFLLFCNNHKLTKRVRIMDSISSIN